MIFYQTQPEKEFINKSKKLEKLFNKKIVTLVWKFEKFYPAGLSPDCMKKILLDI